MKDLLLLALLAVWLSGCALSELMSKLKHEDEITRQVWQQARSDLRLTCIENPHICQRRWLMKIPRQGHITVADWDYDMFPPYQTIIEIHERRFREAKAMGWRSGDFEGLWLNEEILFAIARTLAKRSDKGEISPEQMKAAFTEAWNKTYDETVRNVTQMVQGAKNADDTAVRTATAVAGVVAAAATVALAAAAAAQPVYSQPVYSYYPAAVPVYVRQPIYCNARRTYSGFNVSCY